MATHVLVSEPIPKESKADEASSPFLRPIILTASFLSVLVVICYALDNMPLKPINWALSSAFLGLFVIACVVYLSIDQRLKKSNHPWMSDADSKHRARRILHVPYHMYEFLQYFAILAAIGYGINAITWTLWYYRQDTYNIYFDKAVVASHIAECGPLYAWQKTPLCNSIESAYTWFYVKNWSLYLHAIFGGIVLACGAHQIWWPRGTKLHKWTGYIYFGCQLPAAAGAIALSLISQSPVMMGGFLILAVYWLITLGLGMYHICISTSTDRVRKHRACMLMNYGGTWSAVALRLGSVFGSGIWYQGIPWSLIFPVLSVIATCVYVRLTREREKVNVNA